MTEAASVVGAAEHCPECGGQLLAAVSSSSAGGRLRAAVTSVICTGCGLSLRLPSRVAT